MTSEGRPRISPLGDAAVVVTFGDNIDTEVHKRVMGFAQHLDSSPPPAMVEYVPAFTTITLFYDALTCKYEEFAATVEVALGEVTSDVEIVERKPVDIPVCYGGELGPDLDFVAVHNHLSPKEVVEIHSGEIYVVYMIGFAPGFPYLGGMSPRIAAPRLEAPRGRVPQGSVGIAGAQTGVYSVETPGGWRLIGRTPRRLFEPRAREPSLLQAGDRVRFAPIQRDEFETLAKKADL